MAEQDPTPPVEQTVPPAETPAPIPEETPAPEPQQGTDFVDFPNKEIEARFNRIYRNMKEFEQSNALLAEQNQRLEAKLMSLAGKQDTERAKDILADLRGQKVKALNEARYEDVAKIDEQIAVLAPRIAEQELRRSAPPVATHPAEQPRQSGLSRDDMAVIAEWASQVDQNGNFLRPWALPAHPQHRTATQRMTEIYQDPAFQNASMETILREVDKRMTGRKPVNGATVLSSGGRAPSNPSVTLTPEQMRTAERMFIPTKLAKTPAEAHKKYAEQLRMGS